MCSDAHLTQRCILRLRIRYQDSRPLQTSARASFQHFETQKTTYSLPESFSFSFSASVFHFSTSMTCLPCHFVIIFAPSSLSLC